MLRNIIDMLLKKDKTSFTVSISSFEYKFLYEILYIQVLLNIIEQDFI